MLAVESPTAQPPLPREAVVRESDSNAALDTPAKTLCLDGGGEQRAELAGNPTTPTSGNGPPGQGEMFKACKHHRSFTHVAANSLPFPASLIIKTFLMQQATPQVCESLLQDLDRNLHMKIQAHDSNWKLACSPLAQSWKHIRKCSLQAVKGSQAQHSCPFHHICVAYKGRQGSSLAKSK